MNAQHMYPRYNEELFRLYDRPDYKAPKLPQRYAVTAFVHAEDGEDALAKLAAALSALDGTDPRMKFQFRIEKS